MDTASRPLQCNQARPRSSLDSAPRLDWTAADVADELVLVTGASGFIGSRLAMELTRQGARVKALVRGTEFPVPPGLELDWLRDRLQVVSGDITDVESLRTAIQGCRYVYHLAGYAKNWAADPRTYDDVNVRGLQNVLDVSMAERVERIVWTSTVVTFQPTQPGEVGDESVPRTSPFLTDYERTKAQGEQLASEYAARGTPVVMVNPSRVYGPGHLTESNSLVKIIDLYDRGRAPFILAGGRTVGNYVFIDDVVAGLILAMQRGRPGRRYLIGGPNASFREFYDTIDRVSGKRHFRMTIRRPGALAFAYFQQWRAKWWGAYPEVTPPWVELFLLDWAYSTRRAEEELGYKYLSLEEGIRRTYEWLLRIREERCR